MRASRSIQSAPYARLRTQTQRRVREPPSLSHTYGGSQMRASRSVQSTPHARLRTQKRTQRQYASLPHYPIPMEARKCELRDPFSQHPKHVCERERNDESASRPPYLANASLAIHSVNTPCTFANAAYIRVQCLAPSSLRTSHSSPRLRRHVFYIPRIPPRS
jgi:hypothetical protein